MTSRSAQSFTRPTSAAIADGATTPAGGVAGAVAWSSTLGTFVRWSGTAWQRLSTAPSVLTAVYTTASLAAGATEQGSVTLATSYRLIAVQTSAAARVRLYTTAAARSADLPRAAGTTPGYNAGVVLDLVTTGSASYDLAPTVTAHNREATPVAAIPITVTATAAGVIAVTLTYAGGV